MITITKNHKEEKITIIKNHKEENRFETAIINQCKDDILFYHNVDFDFTEGGTEHKFKKDKVDLGFVEEEKDRIIQLWVEGVIALGNQNASFIETIYDKLKIKRSFHIQTCLCENSDSNIDIKFIGTENRHVFIEASLPKIDIPSDINNVDLDKNMNFDIFMNQVRSKNQGGDTIIKAIDGIIEEHFKNLSDDEEFTKIVGDDKETFFRVCADIVRFNYPTENHSEKRYSAFVSPTYVDNEGKEQTAGGYALFFKKSFDNFNLDFVKKAVFQATLEANSKTIKVLQEKQRRTATESAITAIMGRNMSHNIGSHVIYYLRQHLNGDISKITELLQDFVDVKIQDDGKADVSLNVGSGEKIGKKVDLKELNDIDLPFLKGLGTFFTYIQERQDFIAALSSGYKPSFSSVNFKSFIVDNFLRDLQAKRHSGNNIAKKEDNILLKFIVKSEGKNVVFTLNKKLLDANEALDVDDDIHKFSIDIPGGTLGRQAFYSILENLIRNAAKHGNKDSKELKLDIRISDLYDSDEYDVTLQQAKLITGINDLKPNTYKEEIKDNPNVKNWKQSYYQIKIKDNNKSPRELAEQLRKSLQSDLIDEVDGKLVENEKGLKEMVISALWLNGLSITDVSNKDRLKYIDVEVLECGELEYIFYVTKSKRVLFVVEDAKNEKLKKIIGQGLNEYAVVTKANFEQKIEECSRYSLVVDVDGVVDKKYNNKLRRYLNCKEALFSELKGKYYEEAYKTIFKTLPEEISNTAFNELIVNHLETNSIGLYLLFYHWYIKETFYENTKFPNIVLNIEDNKNSNEEQNETVDLKANYYKDLYLNKCDSDNRIKLDDNIYVPYTGNALDSERKLIAFRRHMHNDVSEFFGKTDDKQYFQSGDNANFIGDTGILTQAQKQYLSVESITGDNSSFRILTNEEKDDLWTLKKVEAAAAKVLIIDERIYDNSVFYQEGGITEESQKEVRKILGQFFEVPNNEKLCQYTFSLGDVEDLISEIFDNESSLGVTKEKMESFILRDIHYPLCIDNMILLREEVIKILSFGVDKEKRNVTKCLLNHLKNIEIANIEKQKFVISDFRRELATVEYKENSFKLTNCGNNYNYISVHQGILDKLYKQANRENLEQEDKELFTKQIIEELQRKFNAIKVVIHTGRGKPNYIKGIAPYRSLSDLDYALSEPKELLLNYFESSSYEL